jgi:hypothetical protein
VPPGRFGFETNTRYDPPTLNSTQNDKHNPPLTRLSLPSSPPRVVLLRYPHGLWGATTMDAVLDFLASNNFNAIRVPFSLDLALNLDQPPEPSLADPTLQGLTSVRAPHLTPFQG